MPVSYCGEPLSYGVYDPTGNITALVESAAAVADQPSVAALVMREHPEVEQVGYLRFIDDAATSDRVSVELRMAGGEFCGNATLSAAAAYAARVGLGAGSVWVRVSGAAEPVEVRLTAEADGSFAGSVHMPSALTVEQVPLTWRDTAAELPLVRMEGISHLVIEPGSGLFWLLGERASAEQAVRAWCAELKADGLGLMFLEGEGSTRRLTPLVFVPGGDTVFWENSCASGSSAVGMCFAKRSGVAVALELREPGGTLWVESDPAQGETWLHGHVREASRA